MIVVNAPKAVPSVWAMIIRKRPTLPIYVGHLMRLWLSILIGVIVATSSAFADHPQTVGGIFGGGGGGRFKGDPVGHCVYLAAARNALHRKSGSSMRNGWNSEASPRIERICEHYAPDVRGNHEFFKCLKTSVHPVDSAGGVGELTDAQFEFCASKGGV
jgi:hypothetical protein